jgi:Domain of unknown function (DUF4259)
MGTWGTGPFDNDGARDWLADFGEGNLDVIDSALDDVFEEQDEELVDSFTCEAAVAAIGILAHVANEQAAKTIAPLPNGLQILPSAKALSKSQVAKATRAGKLVLSSKSELSELHRESGTEKVWRGTVTQLLELIASHLP